MPNQIDGNLIARLGPKLTIALISICLITISACSDQFQKEDLIGIYVLNIGAARDTIELKGNGEYLHSYYSQESPEDISIGKWKLETTLDGPVITLDHFRRFPRVNRDTNEYHLLKPTRFFGSIRLMQNSDVNEFYRKK